MSFRLNLFIFLLLLLFPSDWAYSSNKANPVDFEYHPGSILAFTKYLISRDEYYRAYIELKRLNSYYPAYIRKEILYTTELYLLFKGRRFSEILESSCSPVNREIELIETMFKTDVHLARSDYIKANSLLIASGNNKGSSDLDLYIYKRTFLSYLLLNRIVEAKKLLNDVRLVNNESNFDKYEELIKYSENNFSSLQCSWKSLVLGIVPGMGYFFSGRKSTGIIAFLVVTVFSALTYFSFETNNKPIGIFFGAAGTCFYTGSIIGGCLASRKYNEWIMRDMKESLLKRMALVKDRNEIYSDHGLPCIMEK